MNIYSNFIPILTDNQIIYFSEGGAGAGSDVGGNSVVIWIERRMNCLRCGYCCHKLSVVIVSNPELGIVENNLEVHNGPGPCKHLRGDKSGEYYCAIHNQPWYSKTPCAQYIQIGNGNCRIGQAIMYGKLKAQYPELEWSLGIGE